MKIMRMTTRLAVLAVLMLTVGNACRAQAFPLRSGDWEVKETTSAAAGTPQVLHFCMNDETWLKVMRGPGTCTNTDVRVTASGAHYVTSCSSPAMSINGPVDLVFDGKEHMTGKMTMTMTMRGQTTTSDGFSDLHWKAATCDGTESNLRKLRH